MATFYENLKKALEKSKRSFEELSQHIGLQESDFKKYNSEADVFDEEHFPDYETVSSIAEYLGFSVESLVSGAFPVKVWGDHGYKYDDYYEDYNGTHDDDAKLELFARWGVPEELKQDHDWIVSKKYRLDEIRDAIELKKLKVALFNGREDVTDEEWNEVQKVVDEIQKRHNKL